MFREINDLSDMIRVVSHLPVDCLHDGVVLAANCDGAHKVVRAQRFNRVERDLPTLLPISQHFSARRFGQHNKFQVTVAFRFLAVAGQEISPARQHVAGHVLEVNGDAVRLFIDRAKEIFVVDLRKGAFRKLLVTAKSSQRVCEIMLADRLRGHDSL